MTELASTFSFQSHIGTAPPASRVPADEEPLVNLAFESNRPDAGLPAKADQSETE